MKNTIHNNQTRKEFFSNVTKYTAGITAGFAGLSLLSCKESVDEKYSWPWQYKPVDPEGVRILAHDYFLTGKMCGAGAFGGILTALQKEVGEPFTKIPMENTLSLVPVILIDPKARS